MLVCHGRLFAAQALRQHVVAKRLEVMKLPVDCKNTAVFYVIFFFPCHFAARAVFSTPLWCLVTESLVCDQKSLGPKRGAVHPHVCLNSTVSVLQNGLPKQCPTNGIWIVDSLSQKFTPPKNAYPDILAGSWPIFNIILFGCDCVESLKHPRTHRYKT